MVAVLLCFAADRLVIHTAAEYCQQEHLNHLTLPVSDRSVNRKQTDQEQAFSACAVSSCWLQQMPAGCVAWQHWWSSIGANRLACVQRRGTVFWEQMERVWAGLPARRCCHVTTLQNWWPFLEPPHVTDESSLPPDPNRESKTVILAHMTFDSVWDSRNESVGRDLG